MFISVKTFCKFNTIRSISTNWNTTNLVIDEIEITKELSFDYMNGDDDDDILQQNHFSTLD